jgi:hypothetical protein
LRRSAPSWYPARGEVVTVYWRDLLTGLREVSIAFDPITVPEPSPTLLHLVREQNLSPGWYLTRVTDHFLLLCCHGFGLACVHDNRRTGAVLTGQGIGRRKVTHLARLLGGPLLRI